MTKKCASKVIKGCVSGVTVQYYSRQEDFHPTKFYKTLAESKSDKKNVLQPSASARHAKY